MTPRTLHWTERSLDDYQYKVATDFVLQLDKKMEAPPRISRKRLAGLLSVSTGRVSQVFNDPGNLSLRSIIKYARALGLKVAVVAYDDNDPSNERGPVNSEIFQECWNHCGQPRDFFELEEQLQIQGQADTINPHIWDLTVLVQGGYKHDQDSTTARFVGALGEQASNINFERSYQYAGNRANYLQP